MEKTLEKHKLVIDEWFVNGFNGTKAYQAVYPNAKDSSAASNFEKLLRITEIQAYIKEKKEEAKMRLRSSHDSVLDELENWAYSDITETLLLTPGQLKELPSQVRRLITRFESTTRRYDEGYSETVVKLWFVSKEKAMEMLNKHTGFYEKDNRQKTTEVNISPIEWSSTKENP